MFHIWVLGSNIAIGLYVLDMCLVLCVPYVGVGSSTAIGLYVVDLWCVLCVPYVGGWK